ncbi:DNA replication initiation control protein YabA [Desulforamulus ferrireducens]|uniref:DNA replication initiation control protein YabA n=1 Tax=Desulforamulus ferrireducens TaxID=1833852 RepID=A0A1S6ISR8_9FIRM|nr:DNA replication initiation control protein YabA [Desulforamulus ferrireducens]
MTALPGRINRLEQALRQICDEVDRLKLEVKELEDENARLRREVAGMYLEDGAAGLRQKPGAQNLWNLYDKGFHVCNHYFGKGREGECIFCYALINRGEQKDGA